MSPFPSFQAREKESLLCRNKGEMLENKSCYFFLHLHGRENPMRIIAVAILLAAVFSATPLFASPEAQIEEYLEACRNLVNGNMDRYASMKQDELLRNLLMALICSEPEISSRLEESERNRIHGLTERFKEIKKTLPKDDLKKLGDLELLFKIKYEEEMGKARIYEGEELQSLDAHLKTIWRELLNALLRKDVDRAVSYFALKKSDRYKEIFLAMKDKLPELARDLEDIRLIEMRSHREVLYDIQTVRNSKKYSGQLIFIKDVDDKWRIYFF
jgi:hypothetical protein